MRVLDNAEQFKSGVTSTFDLVADLYDTPVQRYFPSAANKMVELIGLKPNEKVLDIACGTGMVTVAAGQKIQPEGRVHAIDLSEQMLGVTEKNARKLGLSNVDYQVMDGENLEFDSNQFDVITSGFGLFFMPDVAKALKHWFEVLKPGGRVIFSSFTKAAFQPFANYFKQSMEDYGMPSSQAWQRLSETEECETALLDAGFINARHDISQHGHHLKNEQQWWEICNSSGLRGMLEQLDESQRKEFQQQHLAKVAEHIDGEGLWLDVSVIFTQAQKPA